ncbi:MAG: LLM class flavin-dependent oxidoreductase [Acidimicrobiia bacterium]|nr:LLM class flavin-dependent oxidoreductase [Acidimicrobiia bacterium]
MFDQMERTSVSPGQMYRDRLRFLEVADEAGFWCYFKSEHHFTPLDMAPSVSTWLSAVLARTADLRVGSLVYLLPFHHPLRLLEEITTLDHLSDGRLEVGIGRGISPSEHQLWGLDPDQARARSEETLTVLLTALTRDSLTFRGDFWSFDDVPIEQRPLQRPYPPLWYPGNVKLAARRGFHTITGGTTTRLAAAVEQFTELVDAHRAGHNRVNPGATPSIGASVRVILAEDENIVRERGRIAWKHFDANITKLWRRFGISKLPMSPSADGDYDKALATNIAFAGTPAMMTAFVAERAQLGIDPLVLGFEWGDLDATEVRRSMDLFIEHVMPATANL